MRTGDLVKEKQWMLTGDLKARIGVVVRDDMFGLISVLWTGRDRPIVTDPWEVYVISNNGGS